MSDLSELEKLRKNTKFLLIFNIAIVVLGAPFWPSPFSIALCAAGGILFLTVVIKKIADYKKCFKDSIVKGSLSEVFSELSYEPNQGISAEEVEFSELVELKDVYESNDLIAARYGKVKFKQADIVIRDKSKVVGENGTAHEIETTCFTGRFLVFDFLKPTATPVKVISKNFNPEGNSKGAISKLKSKVMHNKNKNQVLMESEMFNNNFNVFCDDAELAFYILTPQIIEGITMLSNQYQGKTGLCFRDEKMFVAISSKKDSLEAKLLSNRTIWKEKELVLKDIKVITDFIDLMSLENNTLVAASI